MEVRILTIQDRTVEAEVWTGHAINELSEIGGRHTPASEFPVEYQQRRAGDGVADAEILVNEIAVHQRPWHHVTDFLQLAPQRFDNVEVRRHIAEYCGILGRQCTTAQVMQ